MAHLTIGRIVAQKDEYRVTTKKGTPADGAAVVEHAVVVESDFLRGSADKGELVNVKRYTVDLTGHHADRESALELILSARGNIGKILAPEGSCVGSIVALRMLDSALQVFRHGYGNRIGGGMRYVHPVGHRDANRHVVFGVDDVGALVDILHHAREYEGLEEDGRLRKLHAWI